MSQAELEPLSPELASLLDAERLRPAPSPAMQSRILERIGSSFLDMASPGGPLEGPFAGTSRPPLGRLPLRKIPLAVALVTAGGIGGAGLHALIQARHHGSELPRTSVTATPPTRTLAPLPATTNPPAVNERPALAQAERRREATALARRSTSSAQPVAIASPPPSTEPVGKERQLAPDAELAAERALLEQARTALARGKPADALALLAQHKQAFAKGRLVEEREALAILSLQANHQTSAARELAVEFRQRYPRSMLLRAIDAALAPSPQSSPTP